MKKRNMIVIGIFIFFYIAIGVFLTLNQEKVVYQPHPQDFESCSHFAQAEKVTFNGTRMYVSETHKPTAILYHGNAGSACDRWLYADLFTQAGYGYVLVEYAGYSNDTLTPTHDRIKKDVAHVIEYLTSENITHSAVVGESIGTGPASYHASLHAPEKLILISPFTDLQAVAKSRFWFYPTSLLADNAFDNQTALQDYEGSVLIVHGTNDRVIPFTLGQELYNRLTTNNKKLAVIPEAGHNDLFRYKQTHTSILEFIMLE